nr:putative pentatricopeptide repeat-containing protein At1g56570 [Ipomoea batatas]
MVYLLQRNLYTEGVIAPPNIVSKMLSVVTGKPVSNVSNTLSWCNSNLAFLGVKTGLETLQAMKLYVKPSLKRWMLLLTTALIVVLSADLSSNSLEQLTSSHDKFYLLRQIHANSSSNETPLALSKTVSPYLFLKQSESSLSGNLYSPNPRFSPKPPLRFLVPNLLKSYFDKGLIQRGPYTVRAEMPERDVVAWTAMDIGVYTSCNLYPCAWAAFYEMMRDTSVHPNEFTFSSTLKACKGMKSPSCGALVHGLVIKHGKHESMYVANALLDVYSTLSASMKDACMVFSEISEKNDVSWTTMIAGYTHQGDGYCGLQAFKQMLLEGVEPNAFSFSIAIKGCALISPFSNGRHLHAAVIKHGFDFNIPVMNSILDMYCRGDNLNEANHCFHCMPQRDIITWNTLIAGYEKSNPKESINFYLLLELEGPSPNTFTFSSIIAAVANLAALSCGEQVHGRIIQRGLGWNLELANALIDMYAKCGNIASSRRIFTARCLTASPFA